MDYTFPSGFDPVARDLVENLLVAEPTARLGDAARGGIQALRAHPFFDSIVWSTLWTCVPPPLEPGLVRNEPRVSKEDEDEDTAEIGAAWNALVRDWSEDEMSRADDDDDDDGTVGDPHEVMEPPAAVTLPAQSAIEDSVTPTLPGLPATPPPLSPPPKDVTVSTPDARPVVPSKTSSLGLLLPNETPQHHRGGSFSSGTSSEGSPLDPHSKNGMGSTRRRRSTNTHRRRPSKVATAHPQVSANVIARDMLLESVPSTPAYEDTSAVVDDASVAPISEVTHPAPPESPPHPEVRLPSPDAALGDVALATTGTSNLSSGSSEDHSVKEERWQV